MLKPYVRDSSYFQIVKNSGQLLTGYVFDNQFELITNYINNKILPTLDNLRDNKIHGVLNSDGYLLRNIGDKSTEFSRIRGSDIPLLTISLDRFKRITPNSVVYCERVNLSYITCEDAGTTLVSTSDHCSFANIKAINIEDSTITNDRIALNSLTLNHINLNAVTNIINNIGLIPTIKIADGALTGDKVADRAYTQEKISQELYDTRDIFNAFIFIRSDITHIVSDSHIIKTRHIADNSIDFSYMFDNNQVLTSGNILPSSIVLPIESNISPYSFFNSLNPLSTAYIKDNSFIPNNTVAADGISKTKLSAAIIAKLRVGGLIG